MKKVGILTLPLNDNYGGMLQAVALNGFLAEQGFEVVFLRNEYFRNKWKAMLWSFIERVPFQNLKGARYAYLKKVFHDDFIELYLPNRTRPLQSEDDFKRLVEQEKFHAVIVGSDQVWRWDYIVDGYQRYFLNFIEGGETRKIAYAASFGKPHWQAPEIKGEVTKLLADFHAVSTRESDGIQICQEFGRQDCQQVLDPTLLVGRNFYDRFLPNKEYTSKNKTLLTYVLDEHGQKLDFINQVRQMLGSEYEIKSLGLQSNMKVSEWVTAFKNADYIITDSFHGMVFSILFNKQFIAVGNSSRGVSRFTSLLGRLGISDRMVDENNLDAEVAKNLVFHKLNYQEIDAELSLLRGQSAKFLINALE